MGTSDDLVSSDEQKPLPVKKKRRKASLEQARRQWRKEHEQEFYRIAFYWLEYNKYFLVTIRYMRILPKVGDYIDLLEEGYLGRRVRYIIHPVTNTYFDLHVILGDYLVKPEVTP